MARKNAFQGTPATAALTAAGVPFVLHPYIHDPGAGSYGAEAAAALGIDPSKVFKTLMADVEGRLAVGIVPVSVEFWPEASNAIANSRLAALAPSIGDSR